MIKMSLKDKFRSMGGEISLTVIIRRGEPMPAKYLILVSLDAVDMQDLGILKELPNFSALLSSGSLITDVETIYPSLTYPAHVTMVTGKYPHHHGIINNTKLEKDHENPDWYWYRKYIKGQTLYDLAEEKGLKTCSILWPVTARSQITYNMPEIFCTKKWHSQMMMSLTGGKFGYQVEMVRKFGKLKKGIKQPELDIFTTEVAVETIKKYQPNLLMLHLLALDTHKHYLGLKGTEIKEVLKHLDDRIGRLIQGLKETNLFHETVIALMGDHSQLGVNQMIRINRLFYDKGWITLNCNGSVRDYRVIAKSCDGSSYIYLNDSSLKDEVYNQLKGLCAQKNGPIEFVFSAKEIESLGADRRADFMVEARSGYYFIDEINGSFYEHISLNQVGVKAHRMIGTHGYLPTKSDYQTFLLLSGPGIKKGHVLQGGRLIDHAPTFAKILDLKLIDIDGSYRSDIFEG